jgi:hypothetical protein
MCCQARDGYRRPIPVRPSLTEFEPGDFRHEVELGGVRVADPHGVDAHAAVADDDVLGVRGRISAGATWIWSGCLLLAERRTEQQGEFGGAAWVGGALENGISSRVGLAIHKQNRLPRADAELLGRILTQAGLTQTASPMIVDFVEEQFSFLISSGAPESLLMQLLDA